MIALKYILFCRKSSSSNVQHRLGSNLLESIYEKPKEEVMESEVIQKESILPQNEQKQLRERDQQQKQVTTDASEVNEVKVDVEVCESFENYRADLPESDTTSDITSDTTSDTTNGITSET